MNWLFVETKRNRKRGKNTSRWHATHTTLSTYSAHTHRTSHITHIVKIVGARFFTLLFRFDSFGLLSGRLCLVLLFSHFYSFKLVNRFFSIISTSWIFFLNSNFLFDCFQSFSRARIYHCVYGWLFRTHGCRGMKSIGIAQEKMKTNTNHWIFMQLSGTSIWILSERKERVGLESCLQTVRLTNVTFLFWVSLYFFIFLSNCDKHVSYSESSQQLEQAKTKREVKKNAYTIDFQFILK